MHIRGTRIFVEHDEEQWVLHIKDKTVNMLTVSFLLKDRLNFLWRNLKEELTQTLQVSMNASVLLDLLLHENLV